MKVALAFLGEAEWSGWGVILPYLKADEFQSGGSQPHLTEHLSLSLNFEIIIDP